MITSDHSISEITLGTVQLGVRYGIANKTGKPDRESAFRILDAAWDGGISSFDTSFEYGDSEEVLGEYFALSQNRDKKPFIASKFKLDRLDSSEPDKVTSAIFNFTESSIRRLGADRIPLYMLHNPADMTRFGKTVPDVMRMLIDRGYISAAGVSVYRLEEAEEMLKHNVFTAIQFPMNIFDRKFLTSGMLSRLSSAGIKIFVRSVYLQGVFFLNTEDIPLEFRFASEYLKKLNELSKETGISKQLLAYGYINQTCGVDSLVIGAETQAQIKDTLSLAKQKISDETRILLEAEFSNVPIEEIMDELRKIR